MMILELRAGMVERMDVDELVAYAADCRRLQAEYAEHKLPAPEWIGDRLRAASVAIAARRRDLLARELSEQKQLQARLMPAEERRQAVAERIAELEAELA